MADGDGPGRLRRAGARLVASRAGTWVYTTVYSRIDRWLLRHTGGRLAVSLGTPMLLLETTGARSGERRQTPLVCTDDGDRIAVVASNGGKSAHPDWYFNVRANPMVTVTMRGLSAPYRARETEGVERERLWESALSVFPGYATYQERAGEREIPVIVLDPEPTDD